MDEDKKDIDNRGDYKIKESIIGQMSRIWIVLILFMALSHRLVMVAGHI